MTAQATGDRTLIGDLRKGRPGAWEDLCRKYLRLVHHVVRRTLAAYGRLETDADVEDVVFDLFHSLVKDDYRLLGSIGPPYDLKAWLAVSGRRRAIDFVRKKRVASKSLDEPIDAGGSALGNLLAARTRAVGPEMDAAQMEAARKALQALPARDRLVVRLFYLKGKKYRDVARITGMKMNSIGPTLMRAVERMQRFLQEQGMRSERSP